MALLNFFAIKINIEGKIGGGNIGKNKKP